MNRNLIQHSRLFLVAVVPAAFSATTDGLALDETRVLPPSEIGEVAVFARRQGRTWFLAVLNGPAARRVQIPPTFLGPGACRASQVRDRKDDPAAVHVEKLTARRSDSLSLDLSAGGGFLGRFTAE
jgi:alpha-glucosidase